MSVNDEQRVPGAPTVTESTTLHSRDENWGGARNALVQESCVRVVAALKTGSTK